MTHQSHPHPHLFLSDPSELHLLYVLLDSNLPTGGFVSSSGLESYAKHGFLPSSSSSLQDPQTKPKTKKEGIVEFAKSEIENYGVMTLGFVSDSWNAFHIGGQEHEDEDEVAEGTLLNKLVELDRYHESTLLSHVARRSSRAQGVAMLTLYVRGLHDPDNESHDNARGKRIIDEYKRLIRKGDTPGHLAVCWGVVSAALGLKLGRSPRICCCSSLHHTDL
jgi:urease accessory protein